MKIEAGALRLEPVRGSRPWTPLRAPRCAQSPPLRSGLARGARQSLYVAADFALARSTPPSWGWRKGAAYENGKVGIPMWVRQLPHRSDAMHRSVPSVGCVGRAITVSWPTPWRVPPSGGWWRRASPVYRCAFLSGRSRCHPSNLLSCRFWWAPAVPSSDWSSFGHALRGVSLQYDLGGSVLSENCRDKPELGGVLSPGDNAQMALAVL